MAGSARIISVRGREILDSRGRPTVEAEVRLEDGTVGSACAPSGASRGRHEAMELRDEEPGRYGGLGVRRAVANLNGEIAATLAGLNSFDQEDIDRAMRHCDGTEMLRRIGGNAVIAVSMAVARAAALHRRVPLYQHLADLADTTQSMPMPMTNILSGGAHARRSMDFQDFLAIPVGAHCYREALEMIERVRLSATRLLEERGGTTLLADEGGLSPGFSRADMAMEFMVRSFELAGFRPGEDVAIALDIAATELWMNGTYELEGEGLSLPPDEMSAFVHDLAKRYPVISIEDPLAEDDWNAWEQLTRQLQGVQIVGDDLFVTNVKRVEFAAERGIASAVLIKLNQNGTLSGTLATARAARNAGYGTIVSARSGETEDSFIADLAVGLGAGQIKIGSVRSSERLSKYNQLIRIDEGNLPFAGQVGIVTARSR